MALQRKTRNRRHNRGHVLDVKLSSNQRRKNRLRRVILFCGTTLLFGLAVAGAWKGSEWLLRKYAYENQAFAIRSLAIETDGVLSAEQIQTWAGVRLQDNLLALNLARVKRDLELVPAIEAVAVERVLPRGLRIRVTEREPIARVVFPILRPGGRSEHGTYLVDARGCFMFPIERHQRASPAVGGDEHLPVITGIPLNDVRPGRAVEAPQALAALAYVQAFQRSSMLGLVDLREVDISQPGVLNVTTVQGSVITFGLHEFDRQLDRWRLVLEQARRQGKHIASLDLAVANNSPMTWIDAAGVPAPPPKPVKPSPYKRKHV
jgi:cell division septal protein FtsQ